jgi:hypothetical protein
MAPSVKNKLQKITNLLINFFQKIASKHTKTLILICNKNKYAAVLKNEKLAAPAIKQKQNAQNVLLLE